MLLFELHQFLLDSLDPLQCICVTILDQFSFCKKYAFRNGKTRYDQFFL